MLQRVCCKVWWYAKWLLWLKEKSRAVKPKIRWWKLKETSCQEVFRQEVTRILGGKDRLPDEWDKTAEMLKTAETVLGVTFGKRKEDRETWWWNEEAQESIKEKKAKKGWDKIRNEYTKKIYKKRRVRQRTQLQCRRNVHMTICMPNWKQNKVKRNCTDWLGRKSRERCTALEGYKE